MQHFMYLIYGGCIVFLQCIEYICNWTLFSLNLHLLTSCRLLLFFMWLN